MGHIKEPEGVDFVINSRPLTKKEQMALSKFIADDKSRRSLAKKRILKGKGVAKRKVTA
jgi:hypothetical protein